MSRNPFQKNSPYLKQLMKEAQGSLLYEKSDSDMVVIPSSLCHLIENMGIKIDDRREETGKVVPLPWKNKPHDLRDYQSEAVSLMENNWRGIINFATGLGKTLTAIHLIKKVRRRTLVVVPSESIAKQFYKELVDAFGQVKVGMYGGGRKKIKDITVGIAASVNKNTEDFKNHELGLIIMDEVHHVPAATFYSIARALGDVGRCYGLTATDFRSDGKDIMIAGGCGDVLIRRDIKWGVDNGWLAKPYFIMRNVDTTHCRNYRDDKLKNYKAHVLNCDEMKNQILQDCQRFMAAGKSVLCLVSEVEHGLQLSKALGIPFATGKDKKSQEYVDQLNNGSIPGLIGTGGKVGEGTDTKNVDVLILANFVAAKGPVIQAVGRGLRTTATKNSCIILDYCPTGSDMLARHAQGRLKYYQEITDNVKVV
jgi:superfamily II DNA or RNA helicase